MRHQAREDDMGRVKMLKEEEILRNHISRALWEDPAKNPKPLPKCWRDAITDLIRAVREDCANAAEDTAPVCDDPECAAPGRIAASIRKGGG